MKKRLLFLSIVFVLTTALVALLAVAQEEHPAHKAHHGGVLNVIGKELAHIEVLIREDTLEAWFVGGGQDTGRSVPINAKTIPLTVSLSGKGQKRLVLKAAPMKLAGERVGHCSHFIAQAEWLKGVKEFEARGQIVIKGIREKLVIQYPEGYDPLHRHEHH